MRRNTACRTGDRRKSPPVAETYPCRRGQVACIWASNLAVAKRHRVNSFQGNFAKLTAEKWIRTPQSGHHQNSASRLHGCSGSRRTARSGMSVTFPTIILCINGRSIVPRNSGRLSPISPAWFSINPDRTLRARCSSMDTECLAPDGLPVHV